MSLSRKLLVGAVAVLIIAALVAIGIMTRIGRYNETAVSRTAEGSALSVSIVHPTHISWPRVITASGNIAAWQEAVVSAQIGGAPIAEVAVDVGDHVKRGQLLARFDDASVQAALSQYRAEVSAAQANRDEADSKAERATRLRKSGNLSEQDLIAAQTGKRAAEAQLKSARARLESQELMLSYTRVVAPDDGVISSRSATLGKVAGVGTELFRLVRENRLEWRAELTADQIVEVETGMAVSIHLPDGGQISGTVRQLAPTLNDATRTGIAYVDLLDPMHVARAGMYASGTIVLGIKDGVSLPSSALIMRDGRDYVFLLTPDQHVSLANVTTGRRRGSEVEILAGVTDNAPVVASGGAFLNDGDRVKLVESGASS